MRVLALLLLAGCSFPTPGQQQRSYAESLRPAEVKPAASSPGTPLRKLRVRAYADADYQRQTPRWSARIEEQIARASAVLEAQFALHLEVESVRRWDRAGGQGRLSDALAELQALDPATNLDWVVGFVSSLGAFTASQEELGIACLFCSHLIVRGMFSAAESDAIDRALPLLSTAERESLARERRVHKEVAVFLHEWGHTLGAFHERSPQFLLSPMYDTSQSSFSEGSARIIGRGIDYRDAKDSAPHGRAPTGPKSNAPARPPGTRRPGSKRWRPRICSPPPVSGRNRKSRERDVPVLQKALALERSEDYGRADLALAPLVERYPSSGEVQPRLPPRTSAERSPMRWSPRAARSAPAGCAGRCL
jgi:hypothetical protein